MTGHSEAPRYTYRSGRINFEQDMLFILYNLGSLRPFGNWVNPPAAVAYGAGDRREPAGRGPAGYRGTPDSAPGLACRSAGSAAADHAGDRLPAADGRTGKPAPSPGAPGRPHRPHDGSRRAAPQGLQPAAADRQPGAGAGDERLGLSSPFQGGHGDEPPAIPEAAPAPGGPAHPARREPGCRQRRLQGGLRRRLAVQPGVQEAVRTAPRAGRGAAARGGEEIGRDRNRPKET